MITIQQLNSHDKAIGVVGLGYVGLPLACLLAQKYRVTAFDINKRRIAELQKGLDITHEVEDQRHILNPNITYTHSADDLPQDSLIIVAVPTPVDQFKKPDLTLVRRACETVGQHLGSGAVVCFESTVYPGVTEDVCGPILEQHSGLRCGKDFFLAYSPERVNPGDKQHTIDKIIKVVSGQTPDVVDLIAEVYGSVIAAGVYRAANIKTAEAAKVIENTQRDLNIALINELATIFDKLGLDTLDVLEAAGTKWNFLPFRPGLVGGHCIGVDPYYLTYLAEGLGIHPQIIQAGRRINDTMARFVAQKALHLILGSGQGIQDRVRVGILGVTFKEDVPDTRNTQVVALARELMDYGVEVFLYDPIADVQEFEAEYSLPLTDWEKFPSCDALILAVKHKLFLKDFDLERLIQKLNNKKVILDLKGILNRQDCEKANINLWRL